LLVDFPHAIYVVVDLDDKIFQFMDICFDFNSIRSCDKFIIKLDESLVLKVNHQKERNFLLLVKKVYNNFRLP